MPVNAATELAKLTRTLSKRTIAAFLHPCEIRAYIELVKLNQGERSNCILITSDCFGTLSVSDFSEGVKEDSTPLEFTNGFYADAVSKEENLQVRKACSVCEFPEACQADIHVRIAGSSNLTSIFLEGLTDAGGETIEKLSLPETDVPASNRNAIEEIKKTRLLKRDELLSEVSSSNNNLSTLMKTLERCINCKNCRDICPVCYCRECVFDTPLFEHDSELYMSWAERKSSIRMPAETLFFHLTRMNHMGPLCVGCGMCTEVCPNDVPIADLFQLIGDKIQKIFDYVPGRDVDEEIPLVVYKEEELEPR
jgi:formate dehydrogenase subunit beta